ncbi:hypothetical protein UFOVP516_32 [uncultured Caudovirales phage]|uniref:Uncharacterized protein n=1 Tax=uncultured Caudovirales phage TaxID=2100421 RepID=A0A6J5ML12_9CAUD|nr:hypothetical protein UFOVP516_32 [uncultured Caudovirales phage]
MRIVFITLLIAAVGVVMFNLGISSQKRNLEKTIVLTTVNNEILPSEGDLLRVQYVSNDSVFLCIID